MVRDRSFKKGGIDNMAEDRPVSGDQGQTGPDRDGAPQAEQEAVRNDTPPAFNVDANDKDALYHSQQVFTVSANPDAADADEFNDWQRGLSDTK